MLIILNRRPSLTPYYLYSTNLKPDFAWFYHTILPFFSCDWISTSVICFGVCELTIRVTFSFKLSTVATKYSACGIAAMSSFPLTSNTFHTMQHRRTIEKNQDLLGDTFSASRDRDPIDRRKQKLFLDVKELAPYFQSARFFQLQISSDHLVDAMHGMLRREVG
ncbi:hypothetical protein KIN20_006205 [Parelaphostrongylus tenuis]|uniref:Uncharacterized protein n=1 Tax=Parelaphostrongylus tenuis TaxID=148309 RepID=A0AAD5M3A2_PARTN|nr:hypothetical protein KIN20_006205 [Parelaphostrongylus tenuis]